KSQSMAAEKDDISETIVKVDSQMMIQNYEFRPQTSMSNDVCSQQFRPQTSMSMMSDHNRSDLAPQRQEMSVENVSSGLVPQGQKASDYDNFDPVP
ncbi:hypothetical protein Tco_0470173, partial [Tanacetum coccineum]